MALTFGSLFAGIGGFDLGLERAGMVCKWQVEIDPYARRVLEKHWPAVPKWDDVRTFPPNGNWLVDVICGGFPCQDISVAGKGAGIDGERSGLWSEYVRIIRLLRPRFVIVENVPSLTFRGLDRVLGDLAESGFDAEWDCLSASRFGMPHQRERLFILAYSSVFRRQEMVCREAGFSNAKTERWETGNVDSQDSEDKRLSKIEAVCGESAILGTRDGIPYLVDRLGCLGNAVVPQVAEFIGRLIAEADERGVPR